MPRSLFARLHARYGPKDQGFTRREVLAASLAASAGLLLSRDPVFGLVVPRRVRFGAKRVVVVGAGFGGLACAHELKAAGYDVTVVEARDRIGGRVLSFNSVCSREYIPGRNVEGGGELIGSNHPTWVGYAEKFGLEFLDVTEEEDVDYPILIGGKRLTGEESSKLYEEMEAANQQMNADAEGIDADAPWTSPNAAALDRKSMQEWIDSLSVEDLTRRAISLENAANNGVECASASYLGMLTAVKGGGVEKYWTESEVYRCKGGNQQLALKLAEAIGIDRIVLGLAVSEIAVKGDKVVISCADGRTIECDDVVLATPPPTWKKVAISPSLPGAINPQMGVNVKYLNHLKTKFWIEKKMAPWGFTDGNVVMTWDGTDGQEGIENAALNCFSGGKAASALLAMARDQREAYVKGELEKLFPGFGEQFVQGRFMDWPNERYTGCGYSFPAPGQVTTVGPLLAKGMGRLHFAGEHCCYKFVGYMEGALNSGASLAKKLAVRDGVAKGTEKKEPVPVR
jgi:monoamine oxidase